MSRLMVTAIAVGCTFGSFAAQAAHFSFRTLDDPGDPTFNQLLGINDSGVIAGYFGSGDAGHPNKGYTIAPPYTNFNNENFPKSAQTQVTGINAGGQTSGFWANTNLGGGADNNFGFIKTKKFIQVNDPLAGGTPLINQVLGINSHDNAAGFYVDANGVSHGYAFQLSSGKFTPVKVPHASSVAATGINDNNLICGLYTNGPTTFGFVKPETGGTAISFRVPHAVVTQLLGINNSGQTVGFYAGKNGITHGLYYNPGDGQWQAVNDPDGAGGTVVNGLNNKNQLVGFYTDGAGNTHGMIVTVTP